MEVFKSSYIQKCTELAIEPHRALADLFINGTAVAASEFLDIHGQSTTLKDITALAAALANDVRFTKLNLADTFLGDDGCILIAGALKTNCTIRYLDLRGNSIRADGATALAQMLKVNSAVKCLVLEWNCIGIWEAGVRALADALSINHTLEELDLRNNKIGPNGCQSLALCLRNNTTLRCLDLRWNNIGLLGSKALVDLLKWNTVLEEIQLAGNEVPDDIARAIGNAVERNRDRRKNDLRIRLQADQLTNTVHALTSTHQDTLANLSKDLASKEQQVAMASKEISRSQEAYKILEAKLQKAEAQMKEAEETLSRERTEMRNKVKELQQELLADRETRLRLETQREKSFSDAKRKSLELEASLREADVKVEVLKRDKVMLIEELDKAKDRLKAMKTMYEDQLARQDREFSEKLKALEASKDHELAQTIRKMEDRLKVTESARTRAEEELDIQRAKLLAEKRNWSEKVADAETRIRKEEEDRRHELESVLQALTKQRDSLQVDAANHSQIHAKLLREHEAERERWQQQRSQLHEDIATLKTRQVEIESALATAKKQLRKAEETSCELQKLKDEAVRDRSEIAKLKEDVAARDRLVGRLKEELKRKDQELDEKDEESMLQMKDLQLSITSLLNQRTKRHVRSRSIEVALS
ncbi:hypothetical protein SpCBS45565_g02220 [Spizellomyces sp. 'palustris']|nr:hypothetical protein SpCBS45565_g02220 [Spizellomyces sp. 'palustris']